MYSFNEAQPIGSTSETTNPVALLQNGVVSLIDCTLMEELEGTDEEGKLVTDVKRFWFLSLSV